MNTVFSDQTKKKKNKDNNIKTKSLIKPAKEENNTELTQYFLLFTLSAIKNKSYGPMYQKQKKSINKSKSK